MQVHNYEKKICSEIFSERLIELRQQHGETSRDLARALDVSFSAISNYQLGKRTPDIAFLHKLAEHYNISADYLLGLSDVKSTEKDIKIACEITGLSEKVTQQAANNTNHFDSKYTTLEKCWYQYYTGNQGQRKHREIKLVCTECHYVWDKQGYAFKYCPNCGREVVED